MDKKWILILSIIQLALGFLISLSFVVLAIAGYEGLKGYTSTLVIGLFFLGMGIYGCIKWIRGK